MLFINQRLDIKGNEMKKAAREYYKEKAKEQIKFCGFESGDEDDEDELAKEFSNLRIQMVCVSFRFELCMF